VGVDPLAHADLAGGAGEGLGHIEILGPGELEEAGIAGNQGDAGAGGLHDGGFVRGLAPRPGLEGGEEGGSREGLGGLGAPEALPVHGPGDLAVSALEAVGDGQGGDGAVSVPEGGEDPGDDRRLQEGAGGVVDQDRFVRRPVQGGETGPDGQGAQGAALHDH